MTKLKSSESGFTIAEILVSIVIMAIMVIGLANVLPNIITVNTRAKQISLASGAAQNKIEELRNIGYSQITPGPVSLTAAELPPSSDLPNASGNYVSTTSGTAKTVTVTVTYTGSNGPVTVSETAIIARYGVGNQ